MSNDLSEYHQDFYAWSKHNANLSSLKHDLNETLVDAYDSARRYAASETHLELDIFLQMCPYSLEQTLDDNFYPLVKIASVG